MRKLILIVQTSFDGFVAGPNREFDNFIGGEENLEYICDLIEEGDAMLLGRISYQLLDSDWPTAANKPNATKNIIKYSNWYNNVPKIIVSKTLQSTNPAITIISANLSSEINNLKQQPGKNILIFGSPTLVHSLLDLHLIDSIYLIFHPVIFGEGIPLLKTSNRVTKLKLLEIKKMYTGTIGLNYIVEKQQ